MDDLSEQCALGCRTNLCSVTGTGEKVDGQGACGSRLPSPARQLFRSAIICGGALLWRGLRFFMCCLFCRFASLRGGTTKQSRKEAGCLDCFVPRNDAKRVWWRSPVRACYGAAAAMSSQRWLVRWYGIYGCFIGVSTPHPQPKKRAKTIRFSGKCVFLQVKINPNVYLSHIIR